MKASVVICVRLLLPQNNLQGVTQYTVSEVLRKSHFKNSLLSHKQLLIVRERQPHTQDVVFLPLTSMGLLFTTTNMMVLVCVALHTPKSSRLSIRLGGRTSGWS